MLPSFAIFFALLTLGFAQERSDSKFVRIRFVALPR